MLLANKNFPLVGPSKTALLGTLAALVFAANCAAAPGTIAFTGFSTSAGAPGGFIYDGARMWVTDAAKGLCRMDPGGGGSFTLSNCVQPKTSLVGVKAALGQPVYDPILRLVYLPDVSSASLGIWRYSFNGSTFGTSASGVNIASTSGLGIQQPGTLALGDAGNLYASM